MKARSDYFKEQICKMGREINSILTYADVTLGSEELNGVTVSYEGSLLKSVMKVLDVDSNVNIPIGTIVRYKLGLRFNDEWEYLDYGNFIVYSSEYQADTRSYEIKCYDAMLFSMIDYKPLEIEYPISIRDYITALCSSMGLVFANYNQEFANYNKMIQNELYVDENGKDLGYTVRDVLDELAQVTASIICINNHNQVEIRYVNEEPVDSFDEEYLKNINVSFGELYGPINSIVLSRSGDSDNVFLCDEESIEENGIYELKIKDNQIMNFNDRADYLPDILAKLDGMVYCINDYESTGICYLELGDRYTLIVENKIYSCVMLSDTIEVTQGLVEKVVTEKPEDSETDYSKADKDDRRINQAYIIVNKQTQEIEALTSNVSEVNKEVNNNYQEMLEKFQEYNDTIVSVDTIETAVRQLQTDTYTKTEIQQIAKGIGTDGVVVESVKSTAGTFDENGLTIEKTNAKTKGNFNETGMRIIDATGSSDETLLFAGFDEELGETVVRTKNINVSKYLTIGKNSRIEDYEDGTGIFYVGGGY